MVYSTHYMEEAERLCDRVLLIDRGRLVADDTVEALIARAGTKPSMVVRCRGALPPAPLDVGMAQEVAGARGEGRLVLKMDGVGQVPLVLDRLRAEGVGVLDFTVHSPNLADAFLALTGRALDEPAAA